MRRTVLVAVMAHPDDEACLIGGTLALYAYTHDVYIICATNGEAGKSSLHIPQEKLLDNRHEELLTSAKILGVKEVFFLGFEDGSLCNNVYHKLASKIEKKLKELHPEIVITFEPHGVSGHIDHIAVSFVTTFVVKKLSFVKELWYYCVTDAQRAPRPDDYFIYFPKGYTDEEIDMTFDISSVWEIKKKAMRAHRTQAHDAKKIIAHLEKLPKQENFFLFKS